jgi:hypothetical protein
MDRHNVRAMANAEAGAEAQGVTVQVEEVTAQPLRRTDVFRLAALLLECLRPRSTRAVDGGE